MRRPRAGARWADCGRKRRYRSEDDARAELARIRHRSTRGQIPTRTYECPHCAGWHLSSKAMAS